MAKVISKYTNATIALTLVDTAATGYDPEWQTPGGVALATITVAAYTDNDAAWACQVNTMQITSTPDTTVTNVAATLCDEAENIPTPAKSAFALVLTWLQDWVRAAGLSEYLFDNDAKDAYVLVLPDNTVPATALPKWAGRVTLSAGALGGDARVALNSTATMPFLRKPDAVWRTTTVTADIDTDVEAEPVPV